VVGKCLCMCVDQYGVCGSVATRGEVTQFLYFEFLALVGSCAGIPLFS
jgi:phosphate starvation-inducible membrane PsiE